MFCDIITSELFRENVTLEEEKRGTISEMARLKLAERLVKGEMSMKEASEVFMLFTRHTVFCRHGRARGKYDTC